jgi:hypothetical protein
MNETQDEAQELDAGWDDIGTSSEPTASSQPEPSADEIDGGWDDASSGETGSPQQASTRRPHRKRRPKSQAISISASPVLMPRPAEPSKKQQREHARQQRAYEAQLKQQRKVERKAERAEQAKRETAERLRQAEAEEQARRMRREARERARSERPAPKAVAKPQRAKPRSLEPKRAESPALSRAARRGPRYGVIITLLAIATVIALLVLRQ